MTLQEIVTAHLKSNGFDGLYYPGVCACKLPDLMPCDEPQTDCQAGHLIPCDPETCEVGGEQGGCEWHIGEKA